MSQVNVKRLFKLFQFFLFSVSLSFATRLIASSDYSWAQRTLEKMSLDEKIGQLFMIAAYVDADYASRETGNARAIRDIDDYIARYHIGGLAYVGPSESVKQAVLSNRYQTISKYPLLIAQDLEWGLSMRLADGMRFPKNITLGAIKDNGLIYKMGNEVGRQAKLIGVHMNLSPALDVNVEPDNIAINVRSFGDSPRLVAEKGVAMIRGLQDAGIIASAKHFPGLGDISVDPHLGLPHSGHDRKRLQEVELYPFIQAIKVGVLSIQTEHLIVPALEPDLHTPSSLSKKIVTDLLKKELGFKGLVLSGALRMKALTEHMPEQEIVLKAFLAGHDMLLMPQDLPKAFETLKIAVAEGKIHEKEMDRRVLKILRLKEKLRLDYRRIVKIPTAEQLSPLSAKALKKLLYQQAVAIARNDHRLIPISFPQKESIAYVQIGEAPSSNYFDLLSERLAMDSFILSLEDDDSKEGEALLRRLDTYSLIILAVYPADSRRIEKIRLLAQEKQKEELKNFRVHGLSDSFLQLITALQPVDNKMIVSFFGNPFGLPFFDHYSTIVMAYENDSDAEQAAVAVLMGESSLQQAKGDKLEK